MSQPQRLKVVTSELEANENQDIELVQTRFVLVVAAGMVVGLGLLLLAGLIF